jgi:hypothetical protein
MHEHVNKEKVKTLGYQEHMYDVLKSTEHTVNIQWNVYYYYDNFYCALIVGYVLYFPYLIVWT